MKFTILISCMHQENHDILQRSNVQSDCVVVNQCNIDNVEDFDIVNKFGETKHCRFISTTERGLSRSRNMAIANAPDDSICLICDDDEILDDNVETTVLEAYRTWPDASLIAFRIIRLDDTSGKKYASRPCQMNLRQSLHISSVEITFSKQFIKKAGIQFDINLGSGTGNGAGEENKFILDIRKANGNQYFSPKNIGTLCPSESHWFKGYDKDFMIKDAQSSRKILGPFLGFLYCISWPIRHHNLYRRDVKIIKAMHYYMMGYFSK